MWCYYGFRYDDNEQKELQIHLCISEVHLCMLREILQLVSSSFFSGFLQGEHIRFVKKHLKWQLETQKEDMDFSFKKV